MNREEALQLDQNPNWRLLVKEMDTLITVESEKLLFCKDSNECMRLQERIKAMRFCTKFPMILAEREETNDPSLLEKT